MSWAQRSVVGLKLRLFRRWTRRLAQVSRYRQSSLAEAPVFFANSFPKSGTHLLTQVMQGFTHIGPAVNSGLPAIATFEGDTGRQRPVTEILRDFRRLLPGDIAYGHVHALPEAVEFLCRQGVVAYFILRDPRDVAVSHVHYVTEMEPRHIHHRYFKDVLKDFDARLNATIQGIETLDITTPQASFALPNIRERFEPYLGWLEYPEVLVLRFEDFISRQELTIEQVLDHAVQRGFRLALERQAALQVLAGSINPQRSPTFRRGKVGGWRNAFTEAHKRLFKEVTGNLLVRLGYEANYDW